MKKWLITILLLPIVLLGVTFTGGYGYIAQSTMEYNTWTNTMLWITANSPPINQNTVAAEWICYAKNCSGNAKQSTRSFQPPITSNIVSCFSFTGTNYLVNSNLVFGSNFAVSCWIYTTSNKHMSVLGKFDTSTNGFRISTRIGGNIFWCSFGTPGANETYISTVVYTNVWRHLTLVKRDTNLSFYVDGILRPSSGISNTTKLVETTEGFKIGSTSIEPFFGQISEVVVFNTALSSNEAHALYINSRYGR